MLTRIGGLNVTSLFLALVMPGAADAGSKILSAFSEISFRNQDQDDRLILPIHQIPFADPHLRNCVLYLANREQVTQSDQLKYVFCPPYYTPGQPSMFDIQSLDGLEHLVSLEAFGLNLEEFSGGQLSLAPLSNLGSLSYVSLAGSRIQDLSPLSSCPSLRMLRLRGSHVTTLEPLTQLASLGAIALSGSPLLHDITPLGRVPGLWSLTFFMSDGFQPYSYLSQGAAFRGLKELTLLKEVRSNPVSAWVVDPVRNFTQIRSLHIGDDLPVTFEMVGGLANLQSLSFPYWNQHGGDLTPISGLINLQLLSIPNSRPTSVTSLAPLSAMRRMKSLDLSGNAIIDLSPLAGMPNLESLNLSQNQVQGVEPLRGLGALAHLLLDGNQLGNVSALFTLESLNGLDLWDNPSIPCGQIQKLIDFMSHRPGSFFRYDTRCGSFVGE